MRRLETPAQEAARHKRAHAARERRSAKMLAALGLTKRRAQNELRRINPRRCELASILVGHKWANGRDLTREEEREYRALTGRVTELVRAMCGGLA